jgi:hypothetical protein
VRGVSARPQRRARARADPWRRATARTLILAETSSPSSYSPSAKPVTLVTSETMSCRKRNGGFFKSASVSFGRLMIAPRRACVSATHGST